MAEPEVDREDCTASAGSTGPATEFQEVLFSLLNMCRGSSFSSAVSSPREGMCDGHASMSRQSSMVSEDLSGVPPEEPEWLTKAAAARSHPRPAVTRSRPASRRNSLLYPCASLRRAAGAMHPSPLRTSASVANLSSLGGAEGCEGAVLLSPAPSPGRPMQSHPELLFDRFGSVEGLSAAVDAFYHRLCADAVIGEAIRGVPEPDVRGVMLQLLAVSMEEGSGAHNQNRRVWLKHCRALFQSAASSDVAVDSSAYDAVMGHIEATLEQLGVMSPPDSGA